MKIEKPAAEDVVKRLRRVEGQIGGVIRMLEQERDCSDIITQLAAASHALDRAGFKLLSSGLRQCLTPTQDGGSTPMTVEQMEKLFLSLA
jgi:DNA-binding FrmR family transcriptional regulator